MIGREAARFSEFMYMSGIAKSVRLHSMNGIITIWTGGQKRSPFTTPFKVSVIWDHGPISFSGGTNLEKLFEDMRLADVDMELDMIIAEEDLR